MLRIWNQNLFDHAPLQRSQILGLVDDQEIEARAGALLDEVLNHVHKIPFTKLLLQILVRFCQDPKLLEVQVIVGGIVELLLECDLTHPRLLHHRQILVTAPTGDEQHTV